MMPLSHDWTALNAKIDAMTPTGNTNVTIGLAWGFQLLSPVAPFNAPAPAPDLDKVIIILTDGENTQNRWTSSSSSIDARTKKVCDNIKAAEHQALYGARDRRQRHAAEELRDQAEHVLRRRSGHRADQRVRLDRAEPRQPAHRQIAAARLTGRYGSSFPNRRADNFARLLRHRSRRRRICSPRSRQLHARPADFTPFSELAVYPLGLGGQRQLPELLHARF